MLSLVSSPLGVLFVNRHASRVNTRFPLHVCGRVSVSAAGAATTMPAAQFGWHRFTCAVAVPFAEPVPHDDHRIEPNEKFASAQVTTIDGGRTTARGCADVNAAQP